MEALRYAFDEGRVDTLLIVAYPTAEQLGRFSTDLHRGMPATCFLARHLAARGYRLQSPDTLGQYLAACDRGTQSHNQQPLSNLFNGSQSLAAALGTAYVTFTSGAAIAPIVPANETYASAAEYELPTLDEFLILCGTIGDPRDTDTYPARYTGEWLAAGYDGQPAYARTDLRHLGVYLADGDGAPIITRVRPVIR